MKDPLEVIDQLSHGDALAVLRTLAREDERRSDPDVHGLAVGLAQVRVRMRD